MRIALNEQAYPASMAAANLPGELLHIVALAEAAGRLVLEHYASSQSEAKLKGDRSPLTAADIASHELIAGALKPATEWPVLSEESAEVAYAVRSGWRRFWLVDPLDGTREFLSRNGEFTVNIALIDQGSPVVGVVHAPVLALTYFALRGSGAFLKNGEGSPRRIRSERSNGEPPAAVVSRSHGDPQTAAFLDTLGEHRALSMGSSLKFCMLSDGRAQVYPRFGTTMEWDTAAGQCVLEQAGGSVCDLEGRPLMYNKRDLRNPSFIARA
jgi:3'(2'), 5'-bisphosphate nucleotidase